MGLFAIRDDDTSFFTDPEEVESVYRPYWGEIPVSLAVVPFSVPVHGDRTVRPGYAPDREMPLGENKQLVKWMKERLKAEHIEIMLHGYNHAYRRIGGKWVGEFGWKPRLQLAQEASRGKAYLENLLETAIRVFVPPSNTIGKDGIRALRALGLDLSGIMGPGGDRPFTWDYPSAYLKRWAWWIKRGSGYPYPLRFGGIGELRAYALTPRATREGLLQGLESCAEIEAPFVLATHYWEFKEHPPMLEMLAGTVARARDLGARFAPVSRCYRERG